MTSSDSHKIWLPFISTLVTVFLSTHHAKLMSFLKKIIGVRGKSKYSIESVPITREAFYPQSGFMLYTKD